jgi:plasmid stabilization system protein ParE
MSGFVLHPEAYADLDEIWEYIAADNLDAADRVREEIYTAIRTLVAFPHQGHNRVCVRTVLSPRWGLFVSHLCPRLTPWTTFFRRFAALSQ